MRNMLCDMTKKKKKKIRTGSSFFVRFDNKYLINCSFNCQKCNRNA